MTNLLVRLFVKNNSDVTNTKVRESYGRLAGVVGIVSNLVLFLFKMAVGLFSGSIAIMADAVNNLSDFASSVITLVSFRLAAMPPDDQHPYGHARFEYISGLVVSFLVIAIGFEFLVSSVRKIISPEPVLFSAALVAVLAVSIGIKLWQGLFNRTVGARIGSETLRATATDSLNDVFTTGAVLVGAIAAHLTGFYLDGWLGLLVAVFVLISGIRLVSDTITPLLGAAPDEELVRRIHDKILSYDTVMGMHDLIIHSYGPGKYFVSVHVEVPASQDILVSHDIIDNIERDFMLQMGIQLVIHLDPLVTDNAQLEHYRELVIETVKALDPALSLHDFRMVEGSSHTNLIFDVVIPPKYHLSDSQLREAIENGVKKRCDNIYCVITIDQNYTASKPELR